MNRLELPDGSLFLDENDSSCVDEAWETGDKGSRSCRRGLESPNIQLSAPRRVVGNDSLALDVSRCLYA